MSISLRELRAEEAAAEAAAEAATEAAEEADKAAAETTAETAAARTYHNAVEVAERMQVRLDTAAAARMDGLGMADG